MTTVGPVHCRRHCFRIDESIRPCARPLVFAHRASERRTLLSLRAWPRTRPARGTVRSWSVRASVPISLFGTRSLSRYPLNDLCRAFVKLPCQVPSAGTRGRSLVCRKKVDPNLTCFACRCSMVRCRIAQRYYIALGTSKAPRITWHCKLIGAVDPSRRKVEPVVIKHRPDTRITKSTCDRRLG